MPLYQTNSWEHVSLFITAAHELGHALGLYHSDVEGALMGPYLIKFPRPSSCPRRRDPKKPILPPKNTEKPDTCDTDYDALSVIRREVYIFKGKYFWRLDPSGKLRPNYPAEISRFWAILPKNITKVDAVYERPDTNIVFFIGNRYYVCQGNQQLLKTGLLKHLGLPEDLEKVDAAFVWGHNGRTYFFADTMYWRYGKFNLYVVKLL
ncbi:hypothetical protein C7M84_003858 [Penaeus vannamei]|uniref:Peptidase M10 metallopeptidase domain-containing protein n=1 Tax=Penaeus vannamei TaxID=6689 RepID=A0A3R7SVP2_PENVA|nr:hypothetical protein C7M84_003858 [Penaeus vannamei]